LENAHLRSEIKRLEQQLQRAEMIIEVQKKLSQLLSGPTEASQKDARA
jgi:F0F1-type ATP synthase delta subunit